jgi:hypothetical protein
LTCVDTNAARGDGVGFSRYWGELCGGKLVLLFGEFCRQSGGDYVSTAEHMKHLAREDDSGFGFLRTSMNSRNFCESNETCDGMPGSMWRQWGGSQCSLDRNFYCVFNLRSPAKSAAGAVNFCLLLKHLDLNRSNGHDS